MQGLATRQEFSIVLIKPSHYDDEGYAIQWFRSAIPSNSLAVVHGLALDCKERRVLGDAVDIVITAMDEDNTRIRPKRIARQLAGRRAVIVPNQSAIKPAIKPEGPAAESRAAARTTGSQV